MTGPEHYREAERIIALDAERRMDGDRELGLATAQVHATLALAAATAMSGAWRAAQAQLDYAAWDAVCGVQEDDEDEPIRTDAQLDGTACTACGREFAVGEPTEPSGICEGRQLFIHTACRDDVEDGAL